MNNIEYRWVGEHHAAVIVNGEVFGYLNYDNYLKLWQLTEGSSKTPWMQCGKLESMEEFLFNYYEE